MSYFSFDFGGSTTDVIEWKKGEIIKIRSFETLELKKFGFGNVLDQINLNLKGVEKLYVTGGKSWEFQDKINLIPVIKVNEIESIGRGGLYLAGQKHDYDNFLVVSMGTGTCMVAVKHKKSGIKNSGLRIENFLSDKYIFEHVGGTGVGGGTFLGLCKELLGETEIARLIEMFGKGDKSKVDLSIGEIIGTGLGSLPADKTASNLAKLSREIDFSKSDLAAGIVNLIGQTIAITAIFAAKSQDIQTIFLTGKLTRITQIMDVIFDVGGLYNMEMILPDKADYAGAIGANREAGG